MRSQKKSGGQTFLSVLSCQLPDRQNVCPPDNEFINHLNYETLHQDGPGSGELIAETPPIWSGDHKFSVARFIFL